MESQGRAGCRQQGNYSSKALIDLFTKEVEGSSGRYLMSYLPFEQLNLFELLRPHLADCRS